MLLFQISFMLSSIDSVALENKYSHRILLKIDLHQQKLFEDVKSDFFWGTTVLENLLFYFEN